MKYLLVISVVLNVGFTTFLIIYQQNHYQKLIELEKEKLQLKLTLNDYLNNNSNNGSIIGGKEFKEVKIGNQIWMSENLNVDKFRNGDPIPEAKTPEDWGKAGDEQQPVWCYYDNDPSNGKIYGKLYNWYAVNDPRGLAPEGWHIPSEKEFQELISFLGTSNAGEKMKSTDYWIPPHDIATNESGFTALPGGFRDSQIYDSKGYYGFWWSSSNEYQSAGYFKGQSWSLHMGYTKSVNINSTPNHYGMSVRCIKD